MANSATPKLGAACLCGATERTLLFTAANNPVVRCNTCGQVRVEIGELPVYDFDYFQNKNNYYERRDEFLAGFNRLLGHIERFADKGRLLDVGTGSGLLVLAAIERGWKAEGIEISPEAAKFARDELGIPVRAGDMFAADDKEQFDVIIFNHVVEHLEDPVKDITRAVELLKPGGLLVTGIPNFGSAMARLRKASWVSLKPVDHVWQFTRASLQKALKHLPLKLVSFKTENYNIKKPQGLKQLIYVVQSPITVSLGLGEAMTFIFRKES